MALYSAEQTRKQSMIEACLNVFSGMIVAFVISQLAHEYSEEIRKYIWTGFEWKITAGSNLLMTAVLTSLSVVRGYLWRRHFNKKLERIYEASKK